MKVLIVVDMQNDFIDGSLGTKEAEAIVTNVADRIRRAREEGDAIFFTRDTHEENYMETQEGRNLPVRHCIRGTSGWQISSALDVGTDQVINKPSFGSTELMEAVASLPNVEAVELIGLCTDICVINNALLIKARLPEVPVSVDASCCAGVTPESHENALKAMQMCQIRIVGR
ncbi:MAG: cysteine hydrolase [Clostridia bacterium]|nr:cysteine hydrolase [Clostridia bacterium]